MLGSRQLDRVSFQLRVALGNATAPTAPKVDLEVEEARFGARFLDENGDCEKVREIFGRI